MFCGRNVLPDRDLCRVNIGVYAGAVRNHQALMFRKVLFAFCMLATLCVAALIAGQDRLTARVQGQDLLQRIVNSSPARRVDSRMPQAHLRRLA